MFGHTQYVPVLKWKLGEYQALDRLKPEVKSAVTPLLEMPPVGYDFEKGTVAKSLDEHLAGFGRKLAAKWGSRPCFLDVVYIRDERLVGDVHPLDHLMAQAREASCAVVPVVWPGSDAAWRSAVKLANESDNRGMGVRIRLDRLDDEETTKSLLAVLRSDTGVDVGRTDLLLDASVLAGTPASIQLEAVQTRLQRVPYLNRWRSITLIGAAYPDKPISRTDKPEWPRQDWKTYRDLLDRLGEQHRVPNFGDHAVASFGAPSEMDMRLVKPLAKLRYATPEYWHIKVGSTVKQKEGDGYAQFQSMCQELVKKPFFDGADFSAADRYIHDCSTGKAKTGNLTTWVWVANNRHISKVVAQLASHFGA